MFQLKMRLLKPNNTRAFFLCIFFAHICSHILLNVTANPQTNPCLVLRLPLCSINPSSFNPNFGNGGNAGLVVQKEIPERPLPELPRRQEVNRFIPPKQSSSLQGNSNFSSQDLAVSDLLDKFLKSTGSEPAVKPASSPSSAPAAPAPAFVSTNANVRSDRRCGDDFPLSDGSPTECDPLGPNYCCSKWGYCGPGSDHCDCPECVDYRNENSPDVPEFFGNFRSDRKCGQEYPLPGGGPSQCDPNSVNPCCSKWGFCGSDAEHCECEECSDYRQGGVPSVKVLTTVSGGCKDALPLCPKLRASCGDAAVIEQCPQTCDACPDEPVQVCEDNIPLCPSFKASCGDKAVKKQCAKTCDACSGVRVSPVVSPKVLVPPKVVPFSSGKFRSDRRCGKEFPLKDGTPAECDAASDNSCCSKWGYCGTDKDHCACEGCIDYRSSEKRGTDDFTGSARKDLRCGAEFPLPGNKGPAECDPNSAEYCCSKWGYCGGEEEHCNCAECVNYKLKEVSNVEPFSQPTAPLIQKSTQKSIQKPIRRLTTSFPTLKPLEPKRRPSTRTSSSFRTRDSPSIRPETNQKQKSRGSSRFRDTSSFRRRKPETTTTKRPKSFNEYEEYYYEY